MRQDMRSALLDQRQAPSDGPPLPQRLATLTAVILVHLLVLVLLLRLAGPLPPLPFRQTPITVSLIPAAPVTPDASTADAARPEAGAPPPRETEPVRTEPPPPRKVEVTPPPPVPVPPVLTEIIPLTRDQLAAADIGRLPQRAPGPAGIGSGGSGRAPGRGSGDSAQLGTAPNGEPLYAAAWYRRPTSAELSFYLREAGVSEGWGMIACRTVSGNRVEDCEELSESPAGSGLAGAVRQAAWQFRVLPPRIGGRPLVGAWVRIRIEYSTGKAG
jgi:protein TonB